MNIDQTKFIEMYTDVKYSLDDIVEAFKLRDKNELFYIKTCLHLPTVNRKTYKGDKITKEILEQLYIQEGKTSLEIADIFGVDSQTIRNKLRLFNIQLRKGGTIIKYEVNHNYFDNLDLVTARILGLIASDGNLLYTKQSYRITFVNKDIELNNLIYEKLGGQITHKIPNLNENIIRSEKIFKYLENIGITENKSRTIEIDFSIFDSEELRYAFLIGIIDGNGHVSTRYSITNGRKYMIPLVDISSASDKFTNQITRYFNEFTHIERQEYLIQNGNESYAYKIHCRVQENLLLLIKKIINIYPICGMLDRKYQKLLEIKAYIER